MIETVKKARNIKVMAQIKMKMEGVRKIKNPSLNLISQSQNSFPKNIFLQRSPKEFIHSARGCPLGGLPWVKVPPSSTLDPRVSGTRERIYNSSFLFRGSNELRDFLVHAKILAR
jgi:hypothetical protein